MAIRDGQSRAQKGWLDEKRVVLEVLTGIQRAARINPHLSREGRGEVVEVLSATKSVYTTPQMSPAKKRPRSAEIFGRAEQILVGGVTVPSVPFVPWRRRLNHRARQGAYVYGVANQCGELKFEFVVTAKHGPLRACSVMAP